MGFKTLRFNQWKAVLAEELRELAPSDRLHLTIEILQVLLHGRKATRPVWRYRLRKCMKCPVYDRVRKRCGPEGFPELGCRCYMPLAALLKAHGWLTDRVGDPDHHCW